LVLVVGYVGVVVTVGLVGRKDWWYSVVIMIVVGKGNVTGDKGPNTHWVHGENIEITVNM